MREGPTLRDALENLEFTYLEIGNRCPGARIRREPTFIECHSQLAHPAGNFVLVRDAERDAVRDLDRRHRSRQPCSIYVLPGFGQAAALEVMKRSWRRPGDPLMLLAGGRPSGSSPAAIRPVEGFERRLEVARFMARQFFLRTSSSVRDAVALATAQANVELFEAGESGLEAAGMVAVSESAVGIYNICVEAPLRGRGIATGLVEAILRQSFERRPTVALQCESRLVDWYRRWSFEVLGEIHMFA